jgi:hypothetical protein
MSSSTNGRQDHNRDHEPEPEAGPGWITRGEVRDLLGVGETELRELLRGYRLSRRVVPHYLKSEIQALARFVKQLR